MLACESLIQSKRADELISGSLKVRLSGNFLNKRVVLKNFFLQATFFLSLQLTMKIPQLS